MGGMIDPSIALQYKPAQITQPDPMAQFSKAMAIKGMMQQQQAGQLEIQQKQQQLGATRAMNEAFAGAVGKGPDGSPTIDANAVTRALSAKGYGAQIPGVIKSLNEAQQMGATLQKTKGEVAAQEADYAGAMGASVRAANYDPDVMVMALQHAQALGYPVGNAIQTVQQNPSAVKALADHFIAASPAQQKLAQEAQTAQAATDTAGARVSTAATDAQKNAREATQQDVSNQIAALTANPPASAAEYKQRVGALAPATAQRIFSMIPPGQYNPQTSMGTLRKAGMTPAENTTATQAQNALAETSLHNRAEESQGRERVGIEAGQLRVARANSDRLQQTFDVTYGALTAPDGTPLPPDAARAMAMKDPYANSIANYQNAPVSGARGPGMITMRKVMAINPDYNAQNWQAQRDLLVSNTSGDNSKEIGRINTGLGHLGKLGEAIDAMGNHDTQRLNLIANFFSVQSGGTPVTTLQAIVHKVAPEVLQAYGAEGGEAAVSKMESDFDPKLGDKQLRSNLAATVGLLRSKVGSMENQWQQTMGPNANFQSRFMMPEAQAVADKYAPVKAAPPPATNPGGTQAAPGGKAAITVIGKNGKTHTFTTQQQADAFKLAAGIK